MCGISRPRVGGTSKFDFFIWAQNSFKLGLAFVGKKEASLRNPTHQLTLRYLQLIVFIPFNLDIMINSLNALEGKFFSPSKVVR
jgi:hypothetical protein